MTDSVSKYIGRLSAVISSLEQAAIAVSGGVDSMTLAILVHREFATRAKIFHATSPAVPAEATARVRRYAGLLGWTLHVVETGEFDDPAYIGNPVNRCYFCKIDLYGTISQKTSAVVLSGANLDDLGDYRPGLQAAHEHSVRHPFVEAGVDKSTIRTIARYLGFADLAALPAAPCLASRIETGIEIEPRLLRAVHAVEQHVAGALEANVVRCRVRKRGVVIELDALAFQGLSAQHRKCLRATAVSLFAAESLAVAVDFAAYRRGSAFVHPAATGPV